MLNYSSCEEYNIQSECRPLSRNWGKSYGSQLEQCVM